MKSLVLMCSVLIVGCVTQPKEVTCDECKGTGKVRYGNGHELVVAGIVEEGEYQCAMCGGSGTLYEEASR